MESEVTYKTITLWGAVCAATTLAACGGANTADNGAHSSTEASETAPVAEANASISTVALATTSLDRDALLGVTSETIIEPGPCPFLTESTALATAEKTEDLIRREVSNTLCRWSKNAGFAIRVSIEPLATATPLQDRAYNLDTPPVLKRQAGPGANATILYDTAWEKERPYAMGFEQDDKLIEIFVTGLATDPTRLTDTAEEIAATLPSAPMIETQHREIKPALDFCTIWSNESLSPLLSATQEEPLRNSPYGSAGCKWETGYSYGARSIMLARYKQGDTNLDKVQELGGESLSSLGDRAVILTRPATDGYAGDTTLWVETDAQQFSIILTGTIPDHAKLARTLMENLLSRA